MNIHTVDILDSNAHASQRFFDSLCKVKTRWNGDCMLLANSASRQNRVGAVAIGNGRLGESALAIRVEPPGLVDITRRIDEVWPRRKFTG